MQTPRKTDGGCKVPISFYCTDHQFQLGQVSPKSKKFKYVTMEHLLVMNVFIAMFASVEAFEK